MFKTEFLLNEERRHKEHDKNYMLKTKLKLKGKTDRRWRS